MTPVSPGVVVPAIPPRPPQLSLLTSAVRPDDTSDPSSAALDAGQMALLPADLRSELEAQAAGIDGRPMWTRGFTYAPENHFSAQVRDPCDFATIDSPALAAPQNVVATPLTTGGTLPAATYSYQVTAVDANGQTTALAAVTAAVTGTTGAVKLAWAPVSDSAGVTYNVYGRVAGSIGLIASTAAFDDDQTPTFTDTGTPAPGATVPSSNTTGGPGVYTNLPINTIVPYLVISEDSCSTWGFEERDFKGRALRLLENATPQAIEKEFWAGALAQAKGYPNRYLADSNCVDVTPATPPSVARGQQILQDYLANTGFGGQGMLHCQPQTAPNLLNARRVGALLLDIFDNIIVPGVGYPFTGPVGNANFTPPAGQAWMFCSDLAMVRAETQGTVFPDSFAQALDWGQGGQPNTLRFRAEKFAAAYFDGAVQAACRVQLAS
jgi:hypothetical protein